MDTVTSAHVAITQIMPMPRGRAGDEPGSTVVRDSFTHRPGVTGTWVAAQAHPGALNRRLVMLCQRMTTTTAMVITEKRIGATR